MYLRSNGGGECLEDTPPASIQPADPTLFVGINFDVDAQCRAWLGANAEFCTSNINVRKISNFTVNWDYSFNLYIAPTGSL